MRILLGILLTILILISCQDKIKTENKSEIENSNTQSEFKKIETNNSLELEYQILDENDEIIEFNNIKIKPNGEI